MKFDKNLWDDVRFVAIVLFFFIVFCRGLWELCKSVYRWFA
jgi:hypothetical protein